MNFRRLYILCLTLCVALFLFNAFGFEKVDSVLNAFKSKPGMQKAHIGVCVMNLKTGEMPVSYCVNDTFIPASITKLITSAVTMRALPDNYTFKTRVTTNGYISNGTLIGNLIIKGSVDPTVGSRHFPDRPSLIDECITALISNGINKIRGKIVVNKEVYHEDPIAKDWEDGDVSETYGAGLFAINYRDNLCKISIDRSGTKPVVAFSYPYWEGFDINLDKLKIVTAKKNCKAVNTHRKKNTDKVFISGSVMQSSTPLTIITTMPDANKAFAAELEEELKKTGIVVENQRVFAFGEKDALLIYESPAIEEIVKSLLYRSDNMFAEAVLRANCIGHKVHLSRKNAVKHEKEILEDWGLDIEGMNFYDGSGLSRTNRFSPFFMASLLKTVSVNKIFFSRFLPLVPVCGENGTVKSLLKDTYLSGRMALKSGSMTGVQSYAGFFPADNPEYAVVVMTNKLGVGHSVINKYIEEMLLGLFCEYK